MSDFKQTTLIKDYCFSFNEVGVEKKELAHTVPYYLAIFFTIQLESKGIWLQMQAIIPDFLSVCKRHLKIFVEEKVLWHSTLSLLQRPYYISEHQLEYQQLCFLSIFLLMRWQRQQRMFSVIGPLPPMWENRMKFPVLAFELD